MAKADEDVRLHEASAETNQLCLKMSEDLTSVDPRCVITVSALLGCLLRRTGEARGPGYVQVEVLGGVYEHV